MAVIHEENQNVHFGKVGVGLPNWRETQISEDTDPDDEEVETPGSVKAILGFDPAEE